MAGKGTYLAVAGFGGIFVWSAVTGKSWSSIFRDLIAGRNPPHAQTGPLIQPDSGYGYGSPPVSASPLPSSAATNSVIANDGLSYVGSGSVYKWGGGGPDGWDCSGFVNYVVGHDLRSPIPFSSSGNYSGHGPVTAQWAVFGSKISRNQVQAGDLVVWPLQHMGIAISNSRMVNCPGPNGTRNPIVSPIDEKLGPVTYRRIRLTFAGRT